MSNQLSVTINDVELPIKEYQGQKVVTLKEIDAVHNRPEGTARKRFNDNKKHFIEGVDYFVRKTDEAQKEFGIAAPNGLVIVTESGYLMLVKSFTDDLAWDVQRQLVNTYFASTPNQHRKAVKQTKSAEEITIANKRAVAMLLNAKNRTATSLQKLYDRAGIKPEYQAQALSAFYAVDGVNLPRITLQNVKQTYDKTTIAKMVGIYSKASGGKVPHAQAVGAIIDQLEISDDEKEKLPYYRNGHNGEDYEYTESVVEKVRSWIHEHGYPIPLSLNGKKYNVVYGEVAA